MRKNKATCFAFGPTGSGKTHTMMGTRGEAGMCVRSASIRSRIHSGGRHARWRMRLRLGSRPFMVLVTSFGKPLHCAESKWRRVVRACQVRAGRARRVRHAALGRVCAAPADGARLVLRDLLRRGVRPLERPQAPSPSPSGSPALLCALSALACDAACNEPSRRQHTRGAFSPQRCTPTNETGLSHTGGLRCVRTRPERSTSAA